MGASKEKSYCKLSDEEVVSLAQGGDEFALDHIIARYRNYVYSRANAYFLVGAEKDDIMQEGMIGLYKAVREFKPSSGVSFKNFAGLCVSRQILTAIKAATRKKHIPLNSYVSLDSAGEGSEPVEELDVMRDEHQDPEKIIIGQENLNVMEYKINKALSKLELQVFMYYTDGMSYDEIAALVGKPRKSIDNALQRIKKKLLLELGDE